MGRYVKVAFVNDRGQVSDRTYTYACSLDNVRVGDAVLAPTSRAHVRAIVTDPDVPYEDIDPDFRDYLRCITQRGGEE